MMSSGMNLGSRIRFQYDGPNRRSDWPAVEFVVEPDEAARSGLASVEPGRLLETFRSTLNLAESDAAREASWADLRPADRAAMLLGAMMIELQAAAGQQVGELGLIDQPGADPGRAFVAIDQPQCFHELFPLAVELLTELIEQAAGGERPLTPDPATLEAIGSRVDAWRGSGTPVDSWALIRVAAQRGIPVMRVDRPPYDPIEGPFRVRPNGLLRFGHGHRQLTVDGTFCVSRSQRVQPLINDRVGLIEALNSKGWRVPETFRCSSLHRVRRALRRIDGPVAVRSARRGGNRQDPTPLADSDPIEAAAGAVLDSQDDVLLQPWVEGAVVRVLVVGQTDPMVIDPPDTDIPPVLADRLVALSESLNVGAMLATLAMAPASPEQAWLLDLELAPRLDQALAARPSLLETCAGRFVDWLFPIAGSARIPIAAITGTNGKTTTCHMLRSIMSAAGWSTGLACSDGTMIEGDWVSEDEDGHFIGHTIVLDNPATELAVLESTRGAAGSIGMGFSRASVAACLNISEDHLDDDIGLTTLDEVADLKRTILERADDAVVVNADDPRCLTMLESLPGRRVGLVSLSGTGAELAARAGKAGVAGVLETIDGEPWVVLYRAGERWPVLAGRAVPMSFDNAAEYNLANALHAAVIGVLMGASIEAIARGLAGLEPDFDILFGRLSPVSGLPFEVVVDYAHNPDGMARLGRFMDARAVTGRKLINFSVSAQNPDDFIRRTAAFAGGHFDHYVCKNFARLKGREPGERPQLLRQGLLDTGVKEIDITCVNEEFESIDATLDMARPGDLVVIIAGKRKRAIRDWIAGYPERRGAG